MKRKLFNTIFMSALMLLPAISFAGPAYAACGNSSAAQQVSGGIDETSGAACDATASGVNTAISQVVKILSLVVGAAAVIVIIISGFKYITSAGDSAKVGNAKNTLIYAMVGLAVAALAQLLVHFVLFQSNNATIPPCPADHSIKPPACHT